MADVARQADELLQHWEPMVRACRRILGSREDAEDCAAAAVLQLLEEPRSDLRNTEAFLVTLAKRRALDELRRVSRVRRRDDRLRTAWAEAGQDPSDEVVDSAEARWLRAVAREQLPPATFELLCLLSQGRDLRTAAAELGITVRAAESHLHRARRALRSAWLKTAVVAAALAGLGRRGLATAAPATALGVVALLGVVDAQRNGHAPDPQADRHAPTQEQTVLRPAGLAAHRGAGAAADDAAAAAGPARAAAGSPVVTSPPRASAERAVVTVPGPAGAGVAVTEREPGDEPGAVAVLQECLDQLQLTPEHVGC